MSKQILSITLALVFIISAFCGCSTADTDSSDKTTPSMLPGSDVLGSINAAPPIQQTDSSLPGANIISSLLTTVPKDSKLLPDIREFLYYSPSRDRNFRADGHEYAYNGSLPFAAFETVRQELLDLLQSKRYQLSMRDPVINPHYNNRCTDYYFDYTGDSPDIVSLMDEYDEESFDVRLRLSSYEEYGYFKLSIVFCKYFELEDPGVRTTRNIDPKSEGEVLPPDYQNTQQGSDSDFFEKCSACHGSKKCTHCGGDDKVKKFQAGLGWVEQNCTFCVSGKCPTCRGSGKK